MLAAPSLQWGPLSFASIELILCNNRSISRKRGLGTLTSGGNSALALLI
jgi:hypothetical protein